MSMKNFYGVFAIAVFVWAFLLNWIWEVAHSALYLNYQGGEISPFILFRAAFFDAVMILGLVYLAGKIKKWKSGTFILSGLVLAASIEIWALRTGRWMYGPAMPLVPFLGVGLTPLIQLVVTGLVAKKLAWRKLKK